VQFLPALLLPFILVLFPARPGAARPLAWALALYGLAKVFEFLDAQVFALGHVISGHSLKHLAAAGSTACFLRLRRLSR
jgi:hypothetical protein